MQIWKKCHFSTTNFTKYDLLKADAHFLILYLNVRESNQQVNVFSSHVLDYYLKRHNTSKFENDLGKSCLLWTNNISPPLPTILNTLVKYKENNRNIKKWVVFLWPLLTEEKKNIQKKSP